MKWLFSIFLLAAPLWASTPMEWVTVGDTGNGNDVTGFGGVAYEFQMSKHEVTCAQYAEFLNAVAMTEKHGLFIAKMDGTPWTDGRDDLRTDQACLMRTGKQGAFHYEVVPGREDKPVVNISFFNAMRFANWMHNGKGKGDMETGAYDLTKGDGLAMHGKDAKVWIPTEHEWHKAAFYQPVAKGGPAGNYWRFATRSNTQPVSAKPDAKLENAANYFWNDRLKKEANNGHAVTQEDAQKSGVIYLADVGSYKSSPSYYGTFDQNGNVWEWTEGIAFETKRVMRGGGWADEALSLRSSTRTNVVPERTYYDVGFRLARSKPVAALLAQQEVGGWKEDFSDEAAFKKNWSSYGFLAAGTSTKNPLGKAVSGAESRPQWWQIVDGALRGQNFPDEHHGSGISRNVTGKDVRLSLRFKIPVGGMATFGIRGPNPILEANFNVASLHVSADAIVAAENDLMHPKGSPEAEALKKAGTWNRKYFYAKKEKVTIAPDVWHALTVELLGKELRVSLNGKLALTYTTLMGDQPKTSIAFGVGGNGKTVLATWYDDVVFEPIEAKK